MRSPGVTCSSFALFLKAPELGKRRWVTGSAFLMQQVFGSKSWVSHSIPWPGCPGQGNCWWPEEMPLRVIALDRLFSREDVQLLSKSCKGLAALTLLCGNEPYYRQWVQSSTSFCLFEHTSDWPICCPRFTCNRDNKWSFLCTCYVLSIFLLSLLVISFPDQKNPNIFNYSPTRRCSEADCLWCFSLHIV